MTPGRRPWTQGRFVFLLVLITVAGVAVVGLVTWLLIPPPRVANLGSVDRYPPSPRPYRITQGPVDLFVVHSPDGSGDGLYVFPVHPPGAPADQSLVWQTGQFRDAITGSAFDLHGHLLSGPATRDLARYAYQIRDGALLVDLTRIFPGDIR